MQLRPKLLSAAEKLDAACMDTDSTILYVASNGRIYQTWAQYVFGEIKRVNTSTNARSK